MDQEGRQGATKDKNDKTALYANNRNVDDSSSSSWSMLTRSF